MFAGHIGAALVIARGERRVNPGVFVAAALLPDALLWLFVLLGWETVAIPPDFMATHQPVFVFPYSHGLLATAGWSALAACGTWIALAGHPPMRRRAALLMAAAVASHALLDALVHRPELPLAGAASPVIGLGLWDHLPAALALEAALTAGGLLAWVAGSGLPRARAIGLAVLVGASLAFTILGMTVAPPPPSPAAMAASSLATIVVVCAIVGWLARGPSCSLSLSGRGQG